MRVKIERIVLVSLMAVAATLATIAGFLAIVLVLYGIGLLITEADWRTIGGILGALAIWIGWMIYFKDELP